MEIILETRDDGSFVIERWDNPYHVIPDDVLWDLVCAQAGVDPLTQKEKYVQFYTVIEILEPEE